MSGRSSLYPRLKSKPKGGVGKYNRREIAVGSCPHCGEMIPAVSEAWPECKEPIKEWRK